MRFMKKLIASVILGAILFINSDSTWAKTIDYTNVRIDQIRITPQTGIINIDYIWLGDEERKGSITLNDLQGIDQTKLNDMMFNYKRIEKYIRNFLKWRDIEEKGTPEWDKDIKPLVIIEENAEKIIP